MQREDVDKVYAYYNVGMYKPGITYERTPEEYQNIVLDWQREDKAFFAAGACHILAILFLFLHPDEGYYLVHIKPKHRDKGHHMYASNGTWAFDFIGWTQEKELLEAYTAAYQQKYSGWEYDRIVVKEDHRDYIVEVKHRPPEFYLHLPWERAHEYIKQFEPEPPA